MVNLHFIDELIKYNNAEVPLECRLVRMTLNGNYIFVGVYKGFCDQKC